MWTGVLEPALRRAAVAAFDDDIWELYDTSKDWSQANDLSKQMPGKLHELQRLWLIEATRFDVLPLDDDLGKRIPDRRGVPVHGGRGKDLRVGRAVHSAG